MIFEQAGENRTQRLNQGTTVTQTFRGDADEVKTAFDGVTVGASTLSFEIVDKNTWQSVTATLVGAGGVISKSINIVRDSNDTTDGEAILTIESGDLAGQRFQKSQSYPQYSSGTVESQRPIIGDLDNGYGNQLALWMCEQDPLLKKTFRYRGPNGAIEELNGGSPVPLKELALQIMAGNTTMPWTDDMCETTAAYNTSAQANAAKARVGKVDTTFDHPNKLSGLDYIKGQVRIQEGTVNGGDTWLVTTQWFGREGGWRPTWKYQ